VISNNESAFVLAALTEELRVDGRAPLDMRAVKLTLGPQTGVAEVQIGHTRATACVTGDLVAPAPTRGNEGRLQFFVDVAPPTGGEPRSTDETVELARLLERGVRDARALDMEALCVVAGERCWSLRCDVHVLDHDGNITDASCLAAIAALAFFRRPDVTVVGDKVTIHSSSDRQPVPLALHHLPVSVSFAFFDAAAAAAAAATAAAGGGDASKSSSSADATKGKKDGGGGGDALFVVDPSAKEEMVCDAYLSLTLNQHREVCSIQKAGGAAVAPALLLRCTQVRVSCLTSFFWCVCVCVCFVVSV
jgi:exosome complex component RRP45